MPIANPQNPIRNKEPTSTLSKSLKGFREANGSADGGLFGCFRR
jgi:hypothetical protein